VPLISPKPPPPPKPQTKPQSRTGGTAGGNFNQLHPRGRGGQWIVKHGDGYTASGPDQTTAQLQQRLNELGFKVPVDGQYGPATTQAVQTFQKRYGLSPSMGVDAATMTLLQNPPPQTLDQVQRMRGIGPYAPKKSRSTSRSTSKSSTSRASVAKITPAQAQANTTVSGETKAAIAAGQQTSKEARQTGHDTNLMWARHDAAQAQTAAANAEKLAKEAKAAAVGGSAIAHRDAQAAARTARTAQKNARGALRAVKALKKQLAKQEAAKIARAQAPLPGEVAVLERGKAHKPSGGGGPKMKLTAPKKGGATPHRTGKVQVATSAQIPAQQPDLEETTVAFGYGGDPSMSIPDGREQTPDCDLPIWTRTGVRDLPDLTIPDGRAEQPPPPADTTILDGRDLAPAVTALAEAIIARKAAANGTEFTRALARERVLRARLAEAFWNARLHPRGRGGKWSEVFNRLKPSGGGSAAHGAEMASDYFDLRKPHDLVRVRDLTPSRQDTAEHVAKAAGFMDKAKRGEMDKRKPLMVRREPDGTMRILDGNSTFQVAQERGLTHVPIHLVHLEDLGGAQLQKRLQPGSGATNEERQKVQAIQQRRGDLTGKLTVGLASSTRR
jgi:peptidoglycan hydrolase-like protein with peptidoglycan-binding domain